MNVCWTRLKRAGGRSHGRSSTSTLGDFTVKVSPRAVVGRELEHGAARDTVEGVVP
jgi:hypothetical protein